MKKSTKKYEEELAELKALLSERDSTIKKLNDKVDSLYVVSLEDSQKKEQLQERIKDMENQLKPASTGTVSSSSFVSSSAVYNMLSTCQEKMESMQSELSELTKQRDSVRVVVSSQAQLKIENANLKQDISTLRKRCDDCLLRESSLIQTNRQLNEKLILEVQKLCPPQSRVSNEGQTGATSYLQQSLDIVEQANCRLLSLLKLLSGWDQLPPVGTEDLITALCKERVDLLQNLSNERTQRRNIESHLLDLQEQLRQLQIDYDRLINPMEQIECAYAMEDETDLTILRDALNVGNEDCADT